MDCGYVVVSLMMHILNHGVSHLNLQQNQIEIVNHWTDVSAFTGPLALCILQSLDSIYIVSIESMR